MYEKITTSANRIQKVRSIAPKVGIILGSGLGTFIDQVSDKEILPYDEIPFFHSTSVEGHEGRIILGNIEGVEVVILQGRLHAYEGLSMEEVVFPVAVLSALGIEVLFLTNAAGGINLDYSPGNLVIIKDHINMMGKNPLVGPNLSNMGPRFPDMTFAYDPKLRELIQASAKEVGHELKEGIYAGVLGPTYETPAEIKMLRTLGADMVGMSTVPESIMANYLGLKVCGISCITNMAAGIKNEKLSHDDVKREASLVMETFGDILKSSIKKFRDL